MAELQQSPPPAPKSSSNVWKWVVIGCGGGLVVFAALAAGLIFFALKSVNFSADPKAVEEKAATIFDYSIPGGSQGLVSMNVMGMELVQVVDTHQPPQVVLTLGKVPDMMQQGINQEDFVQSLEQQFNESADQSLDFSTQRTEEKELCDQSVSVLIQEGELTPTGQNDVIPAVSYFASVNVDGGDRIVWLLVSSDEPLAMADTIFNSLECR
jgi:hypothetical protein